MSGSQSEQQGWFHRMTGKPFGQTFGIQKAPSQLEIMQKKQREDLQKAMDKNHVPFSSQNKLLAALAPQHRDIVTAP